MLAGLLLLPLALAHKPFPGRRHHREARDEQENIKARYAAMQRELDERLLPITATTTVMVEMTRTETVWVMPTDQVVFPPAAGNSDTSSVESSSTTLVTEGALAISSGSSSAVSITSTTSGSVTQSGTDRQLFGTSSGGSPQPSPSPTTTTTTTSASSVSQSLDSASSSIISSSSSPVSSVTSSAELSIEAVSSSASTTTSLSSSSITSTSTIASITATTTTTTSSTTSNATPTGNNLPSLGSTIMAGYYPDWSGWYLSPESVDFTKFDVLDFAFALPTADGNLQFTQDDSSSLLTRLVNQAHASGKRVKLSIGGWTGSAYFSTLCADSGLRATFVKNILAAYESYNLDGIDIDWEYPGIQGAGSNAVSGQDSANFLLFLQQLRTALPQGALITLATQVWPFADTNGNPMRDVSGFANVIDWILIMNYDVWGSSSTPGPNAPLNNGCGNSTQPLANAYAAVAAWTSAGMPASKITLGLPAYGYLQASTATSLVQRRRSLPPHKVDKRYVTVHNDWGGNTDGQVMFEDIISQGALTMDSEGNYVGAGGFTREWDSCSSTPWLKSWSSGQIITYDDPQSISLKAQFAAQAGLRGCNIFSIDGDWTGSAWPLTSAARSGLGL